jgi:hypothetical protein
LVGTKRDKIAIVGSFRVGNKVGHETGLIFEVVTGIGGAVAAMDGFKFGSFCFFLKDKWGDKRFVRS